ncbi:efflux RND transporter permease subunit [Myxosarcina sp. GI1]|uniref:efflux RND transporter permease subunit n=1 Tax=Myxosarcina sp. GI1 TaxID=1541065 RepID=UPI00056AF2EA|nr:efflux RND transporter permease subunit [Myxosarcina sp. GI1]
MSFNQGFNFSRFAIYHSRLTICAWLAVAIAGIFAFSSLEYALFPNVTFPVIIVRAKANLETVLDTEARLTVPLETAVNTVVGLQQSTSYTYLGQTVVNLLFDTKVDLETANTTIEQAIAPVELPAATDIEIIPYNLNESTAVSYVLVSDRYDLTELTQIAQTQIAPDLDRLPGVQRVDILGDANFNLTTSIDNASLIHFNRRQAIALQVVKQADANTLEIVELVATAVDRFRTQFADIELVLAETQADYIRQATKATIEALLGAIVLAVVVIYPFLRNLRATLIAATAIPISLLGTFIVMALVGFKLETLTLLALALIIGIIIDDAIVEVENIMRHLEHGNTIKQAALLATEEIGLTVSVSTLTIVAVFLPIALMGGTLGQFFRPFGLTISAAVLTSLLVARTLTPVLAIYWLTPNSPQARNSKNNRLVRGYSNILSWSLNHRQQVMGIAIASLIAGIALIPLIPQGFLPELDRGEFNIFYTTPLPNLADRIASPQPKPQPDNRPSQFGWLTKIARSPETILLRKTIAVGEQLETVALNNLNVESVYTIAGVRGEPNKGKLYIKLKSDRDSTTSQVQETLRTALPQIPKVIISIEDIAFVETGEDSAVKIALVGEDLERLRTSAIALKEKVVRLPGFTDVRVTNENPKLTTIVHQDGKRVTYLNANLASNKAIGDATQEVRKIAKSILPSGISLDLEGESARTRKILGEFAVTLVLSLICMLIVLYFPFRRWLEPMVVGLSLPLSIVGAMLALLITRSDFGMISLIGLIFLLGLLDKNAILLLDYINRLRKSGMERTQAILETGVVRLRPIFMTTISTILGMLPISLGLGAGSELRQPMAVAIIGGLITSSILSLIVVPVLYTLLEDWNLPAKSMQKSNRYY